MRNTFIIPVGILILYSMILIGCSNSGSGVNYDELAKELCKCMTPMSELNEEIKAVTANGDQDQLRDLFGQLESASKKSSECAEALEAKYGSIEGDGEKLADEALAKHCPSVAQFIQEAKSMQEDQ